MWSPISNRGFPLHGSLATKSGQTHNNLPLQPIKEGDFQSNSLIQIHVSQANFKLNLLHIFSSTENTSSALILFILKQLISSWISLIQSLSFPLSESQLFLKLIVQYSLVVLFLRGSTISSGGYYSPCSRPLELSLHHHPMQP